MACTVSGLKRSRPEYQGEFQTHYFDNHMFDALGPDHERGYASFIPTVDGRHVLKRQWFAEDTFARREQLFTDIEVSPDRFGEYLLAEHGLHVRAMPPSGMSATTSSASRCAPATSTTSSLSVARGCQTTADCVRSGAVASNAASESSWALKYS